MEPGRSSPSVDPVSARFLWVEADQKRFAILAEQVLLVQDWEEPNSLPLSSPSIMGWLPYEGCAIAVLNLRAGPGSHEPYGLLVLLEGDGQRIFVPGTSVRILEGTLAEPPEDAPAPHSLWLATPDGSGAPVLDVPSLYRSFHLGYNHPLDG